MKDIVALANHFAEILEIPSASLYKEAGKKPMSRNNITKTIEKARKNHAALKKEYDSLQADDVKLKSRMEENKNKLQHTRKQIMTMHKGLNNMDMANAEDAVFYDDDDVIGYMVDNKEFHMEICDDGEIKLIPMNKYRKECKSKKDEEKTSPEEDEAAVEDSQLKEAEDMSDEDLMSYLDNSLEE